MAMYDRVCRSCGISFKGGPRAWYCPNCRAERKKEQSQRCKREGPRRPLGSKDVCKNCGKEYTVECGLQMYCPDCQPEMHRKLDTEQGKAYYQEVVSKDLKLRSEKRKAHYAKNKDEINRKRREKYAEKKNKDEKPPV